MTDKEILQVWYETGDASTGLYFIGHHASGSEVDAKEGVCDYELYPLKVSEVDTLLYNMVWDFIMESRSGYFVFPADIPNYFPSGQILKYPYLIVDYEWYQNRSPMLDDDDDELYIKACNVAQWDVRDGYPDVKYYAMSGFYVDATPGFRNNHIELKKAIAEVLKYIETRRADVGEWKERLQVSLNMLETGANELHILHNAGLYDIDALWTLLLRGRTSDVHLQRVSMEMTSQLHHYAMWVINRIDWHKGGLKG